MGVGFIILAHENLNRVAQIASYWANRDSPTVIHIDARTRLGDVQMLKGALKKFDNIRFVDRRSCAWGTFSIVAATQDAAEVLLHEFSNVSHAFLVSGSCIPLRPVQELNDFLASRPGVDFIESVITEEVTWTVGGLDHERFTLRFPFSWKKHRRLFDQYVNIQRSLGVSRKVPKSVKPHLGSQWWCLTRSTLSKILTDPERAKYDAYFCKVWIPDESYFQSLVRKHSTNIESRSLTFSRFDNQGKPHVFYDDHLQLLKKSDRFVARKIWPRASNLYRKFLNDGLPGLGQSRPDPQKLDRIFSKANGLRTKGRHGLRMQSKFPVSDYWNLRKTCAPYTVFEGFSDIFSNFETWLGKRTGTRIHGHLFSKERAMFAGGSTVYNGCLSDSAKLRDYNPDNFFSSLIWNTQGERQILQFGPADKQKIGQFFKTDPNATVNIITGGWAVPLFHAKTNFLKTRRIAARYQATEAAHVKLLREFDSRAHVNVWTLSDFVENPVSILQSVLKGLDVTPGRKLTEVPKMIDLAGFGEFVQKLKNEGMNPHAVGDFPLSDLPSSRRRRSNPNGDNK